MLALFSIISQYQYQYFLRGIEETMKIPGHIYFLSIYLYYYYYRYNKTYMIVIIACAAATATMVWFHFMHFIHLAVSTLVCVGVWFVLFVLFSLALQLTSKKNCKETKIIIRLYGLKYVNNPWKVKAIL